MGGGVGLVGGGFVVVVRLGPVVCICDCNWFEFVTDAGSLVGDDDGESEPSLPHSFWSLFLIFLCSI